MNSIKQEIEELLPVALQCGISILDFYDMTMIEVVKTIEAYQKKDKLRLQEKAYIAYQESQLISCFIGSMFKKGQTKLPTMYDAFGALFEEEIKQQEMEQDKARILAFVNRINDARKEQNGG